MATYDVTIRRRGVATWAKVVGLIICGIYAWVYFSDQSKAEQPAPVTYSETAR